MWSPLWIAEYSPHYPHILPPCKRQQVSAPSSSPFDFTPLRLFHGVIAYEDFRAGLIERAQNLPSCFFRKLPKGGAVHCHPHLPLGFQTLLIAVRPVSDQPGVLQQNLDLTISQQSSKLAHRWMHLRLVHVNQAYRIAFPRAITRFRQCAPQVDGIITAVPSVPTETPKSSRRSISKAVLARRTSAGSLPPSVRNVDCAD